MNNVKSWNCNPDRRFKSVHDLPLLNTALYSVVEGDFRWLAELIESVWKSISPIESQKLLVYWSQNPTKACKNVKTPWLVVVCNEKPHRFAATNGSTIEFESPAFVHATGESNGLALCQTAIAHELAHVWHIAEGRNVGKTIDQIEKEVDAITSDWGFCADARGWIEKQTFSNYG